MTILWAILGAFLVEPLARVDVYEPIGAPYCGALRCGILLDRGKWSGEGALVARAQGASARVQARVLGRHTDGSARRVELVFPVELSPGACVSFDIFAVAAPDDPFVESVEIDDEGERVSVRSVGLDVVVAADPLSPIAAFGRRGLPSVIASVGGLGTTRGRLSIEERGPYVVRLLIEGECPVSEGVSLGVRVRVTIDLCADSATIETWLTDDTRFGKSDGIMSRFTLGSPIRSRRWTSAGILGDAVGRPSAVTADGDGNVAFYGIKAGSARRKDVGHGVLRLKTDAATLDFSVRDFEMTGPSVLESDGGAIVGATLLSPDYFLSPGVSPQRAIRLTLVDKAHENSPPRPFAQPIGIAHHCADDFDDAVVAAPETAKKIAEVLRLEVIEGGPENGFLWPGAENYGDWLWSRSDAGNLEFDTTAGLFRYGRALRRGPILDRAVAAARHLLSRDVDRGRTGLVLRHGAHHRKGGIEAGHMWIDGLIDVAFATCDPFLLEGVRALAENFGKYLARTDIEYWNTRSVAWSLLFTAAAHREFGELCSGESIAKLVQRTLDSGGSDRLLVERPDRETGVVAMSTWVTAGILGAGIAAHRDRSDVLELKRRYLATMEMLLREAYDEKSKELADTVEIDRIGGIARKSGVTTGEQMLFFATAARWMRPEGPETAARRRLDEIARLAAKKFQVKQKTLRGMEISQMLWAAPRLFGRGAYR